MREMKDSGIPWVGGIPKNWEIMPNKYLMHKVKKICPVYNGENILSLTIQGVIIRDFDLGGKMPATFDGYQIIYPGNLLMCLFDYDVTPRCIGLIKDKGLTSPAYSQFVMNQGADARYYYYYYLLLDFTKELLHLAKNLRHSFTEEQLGKIKVPVPPIEAQQRIADFLDSKCAKIDSVKKNVEAEIETLKEYKKSVITEAVTKGLNKNVEMKDSGIPWIGNIPKKWQIVPLKRLVLMPIKDGTHQTPTYTESSNGIPFLSSGNVRTGKINWENIKYITPELHEKLSKEVKPQINDILLAKNGTTGVAAIVDKNYIFDVYVTLAVIRANPQYLIPRFLLYAINSNISKYQFNQSLKGIGTPNLHLDEINKTRILVPTLAEQCQIADFLDAKCARIDSIVEDKQKQISTLDEYKKSLIYEYVTGKKEVPSA